MESISRILARSSSSHLGLLSHKIRRFIECIDPVHGPQLHIHQPIRVTKDLHILRDFDFLQISAAGTPASSEPSTHTTFGPGVSCDLFLTSLCLFERELGFMADIKAALLRKWQLLSTASQSLGILPLFYRADAISPVYMSKLHNEIMEMNLRASNAVSTMSIWIEGHTNDSLTQVPSYVSPSSPATTATLNIKRYTDLMLIPLHPQDYSAQPEDEFSESARPFYAKASKIRTKEANLSYSPFSSNSNGLHADIMRTIDDVWHNVYIKRTRSALQEVKVLPMVRHYFPEQSVQNILAVDEERKEIFFKRFQGETLSEARLRYHHGQRPFSGHLKDLKPYSDEWFIDLDLRRASDVLAAYQRSFGCKMSPVHCFEQEIHTFYSRRLRDNRRFFEFYGQSRASFLHANPTGSISLEDFLDTSITIDGRSYGTLRRHFDRATYMLDPERYAGLQSLPCAFGLGDGHGGNVMTTLYSNQPALLYIDYEVAGYHTPFLDMAKPIYLDGFFDAAYADLLYNSLPCKSNDGNTWVQWTMEDGHLSLSYGLALEPLWKTLACIKLEYVLRPILEMLEQLAPSKRETAEDILACALFTCALLSRDYSARPDVFYLNVALGIRLATEMRDVFSECFGWSNWPCDHVLKKGTVPYAEPELETNQLTMSNRKNLFRYGSRSSSLFEPAHQPFSVETENLMVALLSDDIDKHNRRVPSPWIVYKSLDVETVFLKKEKDTLALHSRFSTSVGESTAIISQRIDHARKEAMKVRGYPQ